MLVLRAYKDERVVLTWVGPVRAALCMLYIRGNGVIFIIR